MQLLKSYIPKSHEPVWHLFDQAENTLESFTPDKHRATNILNHLQQRNKRPRAHPHTFYTYLAADQNKAAVYASNAFHFTGEISDEQKRYFHFIKLQRLQPIQTSLELEELAKRHNIYIGTPTQKDLVSFQIVQTFLTLANRDIGGPLKSYALYEIEDMIAAFSKHHCSDLIEPIRFIDMELIELAAHAAGVAIVNFDRPYLNRVQRVRLKGRILLPRKFWGDTVNYMRPFPTRLQQSFKERFYNPRTAWDENCVTGV